MKKILDLIKEFGDTIRALSYILLLIILILSAIFTSTDWNSKNLLTVIFNSIFENRVTIWLIILSWLIVILGYQYLKIRRQLLIAFKDDFKTSLDENWDYKGWKCLNGELTVTGSDQGGLTKKGTFWENYKLSFETKIIEKCIGVIVRAKDINDYYMFQISLTKIVPHRRVIIPVFESTDLKENLKITKMQIAWQKMDEISVDHRKDLSSWFEVEIIVNGQSIKIFINKEQVFSNDVLLENAYGKVGFRNIITEKALVRKLKIISAK